MSIFDFVICVGIVFLFAYIRPICNYVISSKKDCDLEWKCVETEESKEKFLNGEIDYHLCDIKYRINPSQLNAFVNTFGDNDWKEFNRDSLKFKEKEDFIKYVSNFQKLRDICEYYEKQNLL